MIWATPSQELQGQPGTEGHTGQSHPNTINHWAHRSCARCPAGTGNEEDKEGNHTKRGAKRTSLCNIQGLGFLTLRSPHPQVLRWQVGWAVTLVQPKET
jgi:hypothetical protein